MANIKISQLPSASSFNDDDFIPVVQNGVTKKVSKLNVIKRDILMAYLDQNYTLQQSDNYEILPLKERYKTAPTTSKFTVREDGGIEIGANCHWIKVNSNVSFNLFAQKSVKWNTIFKNNAAYYPCPIIANERMNIANTGGLIYVEEGNVIYLKVNGTANDVVRGDANTYYTQITLEVIQ